MTAKELYQRSHEESGYYRADAGDSWYFPEMSAACDEHYRAKNYTAYIGADTYELEFSYLPLVCHYQRNCVISGNAEVCGYVQRRADTYDDYAHYEEDNAQGH